MRGKLQLHTITMLVRNPLKRPVNWAEQAGIFHSQFELNRESTPCVMTASENEILDQTMAQVYVFIC